MQKQVCGKHWSGVMPAGHVMLYALGIHMNAGADKVEAHWRLCHLSATLTNAAQLAPVFALLLQAGLDDLLGGSAGGLGTEVEHDRHCLPACILLAQHALDQGSLAHSRATCQGSWQGFDALQQSFATAARSESAQPCQLQHS